MCSLPPRVLVLNLKRRRPFLQIIYNVNSVISEKKVEEPVPAEEGGVKHLKRGPVTMHRIVRRKMMGIKLTVSFNTKGEPYGKVATKM